MNYIGIDIGDGESCVCILPHTSQIEPRPVAVTGRKSFLSAIAEDETGNTVIGMDAVNMGAVKGFSVRFKSKFLSDEQDSRWKMKSFLEGIYGVLAREHRLDGDTSISVGCPAGWKEQTRAEYLEMIRDAGFSNARLVSESRAAFLYAKYSRSIQMDPTLIEDSALVIDIGSSTLDFAYVLNGRETDVGTFGEVYLGGGAIDEALLDSAISTSPYKTELLSVFEEAPEWKNYCLLKARQIKEDYFSRQSAGESNICCREIVNIFYDMPISLEIKADDYLMWQEVNTPIDALHGYSFYTMLQKALKAAVKNTRNHPPSLVLLTGGASRMKFFQKLCRDSFPHAQFILCEEPEYSVAKGLAYSARLDDNIILFNRDIDDFLKSSRIHTAVEMRMDAFMNSLSTAMSDIGYAVAKRSYENWQNGNYATLDEMGDSLARQVKACVDSETGRKIIAMNLADEMDEVCALIQPEIDAICKKHDIGSGRMHMGNFQNVFSGERKLAVVPLDMDFLLKIVEISIAVSVFIIMAIIPGGQVMDLILAVISYLAARLGFQKPIGKMLRKVNFPKLVRSLLDADKVINDQFYSKMHEEFLESLRRDGKFQQEISDNIESGLKQYVAALARKTEIAISL